MQKTYMQRVLGCSVIVVIFSWILSGCTSELDMPETPLVFEEYIYKVSEDSNGGYMAFDYAGRTYISYASRHNHIPRKAVSDYLGIIVRDGEKHDDEWVVRLKDFENDDILGVCYPYGVMEPSLFYRAIDTKDKTLVFPDYLWFDWTYGYWE